MHAAYLSQYEGKPIAFFHSAGVLYITWHNYNQLISYLGSSHNIPEHDSKWKIWPFSTFHNFTGKKVEHFITEFGIQRFLTQAVIIEDAPWDKEESEELRYLEGLTKHIIDTIRGFRQYELDPFHQDPIDFMAAAFGEECDQ